MKVKIIGLWIIIVVVGALRAMDNQGPESNHQNGCIVSPQPQRHTGLSLNNQGTLPDTKQKVMRRDLTVLLKEVIRRDADLSVFMADDWTLVSFVEQLLRDGYTSCGVRDLLLSGDENKQHTIVAVLKARACRFVTQHWLQGNKETKDNRCSEEWLRQQGWNV